MTKKVAVVLSGCGVYDGAEIYESVLTLLRLDEQGAEVCCFAPNIKHLHVIDHHSGKEMVGEVRNVLVEAARIARGEVHDLATLVQAEFDALIVPGGFGAAKNLSDFALRGVDMTVNNDFLGAAQSFAHAAKPVGLICIAPAMAAAIYGPGVKCTIGCDADTAKTLEHMGAVHCEQKVAEICVDLDHKLVTTPAYMLAGRITEAQQGINALVDKVLALA